MLGALIGAGTSLLGGILGNKSQAKANKQNAALQREFAQNSIQWKVEDAKKAGIHPIYALGAPTHSASPSFVGSTALSEGIAQAGQGISRAIDTGRSSNERLQAQLGQLSVQRAELENTKLASEIALMNQAGTPPPPVVENPVIDGQSVPNQVKVEPAKITSSMSAGVEAGQGNDAALIKTPNGYAVVPSTDVKQRIEDITPLEWQWVIRNGLSPTVPPTAPPPGKAWRYNVFTGEWEPTNTYRKYTPGSQRNWAK